MSRSESAGRSVFVIMPFVNSPTRNKEQLTAFFENNIKRPIETAELKYRYEVYRSGETFDITTQIIRDLCRANIVIADLSGTSPNPNVMYELGVRLALSDQPVILIREEQTGNRGVFDIYGFFTQLYDPYNYHSLENHLVDKLRRWEAGEEHYANPHLEIIRAEMARINPDLTNVPPDRQRELALRGVRAVSNNIERAYGPYGTGLALQSSDVGMLLEKRGLAIALGMKSANPFEEAGIRLMAEAASSMADAVGDGTKLPILIARTLIDECVAAMRRGLAVRDLLHGISIGIGEAKLQIQELATDGEGNALAVAATAAKDQLDVDVVTAIYDAGSNGIISIEQKLGGKSTVAKVDHMVVAQGAIHPAFVGDCLQQRCTLDDCAILLYAGNIVKMHQFISILEQMANTGKSLLVVAANVEDEALATLLVNRQKLKCAAIRTSSYERRALLLQQDLAILTGGTVIDPSVGDRLENARVEHLGSAEKVIVDLERTEILGGRGDRATLTTYIEALQNAKSNTTGFAAAQLRDRIARLDGTVVTVRLAADNPQDLRDKVYRTESALHATRAAIEKGCVTGGASALFFAARKLDDLRSESAGEEEGIHIAKNALTSPFIALASAAAENQSPIIQQLLSNPGPSIGYNVQTHQVENLSHSGILDPLPVVQRAIEIAHSVARRFLETGSWEMSG